jgi:hypothetical protein
VGWQQCRSAFLLSGFPCKNTTRISASCFSCLFSSNHPLNGLWTYGRVWRVAFASLTHNRLTTVARLPDHSNYIMRVLLLKSFLSINAAPRSQLHLDFNSPKRHASSVSALNRAGPIKTNRSGKPKVQFPPSGEGREINGHPIIPLK